MRLSEAQRQTIISTVRGLVGPQARVRLFGSRTDDNARGGDIDLMVESDTEIQDRFGLELKLGVRLERALEGRRVDLLLVDPTVTLQPIHRVARHQGVLL